MNDENDDAGMRIFGDPDSALYRPKAMSADGAQPVSSRERSPSGAVSRAEAQTISAPIDGLKGKEEE